MVRMPQEVRLFDSLQHGQKVSGGGTLRSMSRVSFSHTYQDIISVENLLAAWREFVHGKRNKKDVREFQYRLMDNILTLHQDLQNKTYIHGGYQHFKITDPKPRDIHKATVRDRLVHHALYRKLYPFFDATFIADSYSCRRGKGTHRAMNRFRAFARKESRNHTKTVWVLKCDIKKFFASIDQQTLLTTVSRYVVDMDIQDLLAKIVSSFNSGTAGVGLPLGNLTSQLLVNVYMNEFDQCVKRQLKAKYYIRYADDFVILSRDREWLEQLLMHIRRFLLEEMRLMLHPKKVSISTVATGIDFLGWVHFPDHRVLRTSTKRRMLKRVQGLEADSSAVLSYIGMLQHGNAMKLRNTFLW